MTSDVEFSRQLATARSLAGNADGDIDHLFDKAVLLTAEPDSLRTENGKWAFLDSVLLLVRMTKRLTIEIKEDEELAKESRE
jgi:hypothetical protein